MVKTGFKKIGPKLFRSEESIGIKYLRCQETYSAKRKRDASSGNDAIDSLVKDMTKNVIKRSPVKKKKIGRS